MESRASRRALADPAIAVLLAAGSAAVLAWRLGVQGLADFDEAIYAEISREMTRDGSLVVLHWNYLPWYQKPPLFMWMQALLFQIFGAGDAVARVPSLLAAAGVIALTYLIALRFGDRRAALLATLVLLGCYQFLAAGRFATTDMVLTLFIHLQAWAYLRVREGERRAWYLAGVAAGLGIMTKGAAGMVGPLILAASLLLDRRARSEAAHREIWAAATVAIAIALPWHLLAILQGGQAFVADYFGYNLFRRSSEALEGHQGNVLTYLAYIRNQFFPWAYLAALALVAGAWRWWRERTDSALLLAAVTVTLLLYTAVQTKLTWYILPVYPALAILAGMMLRRAAAGRPREVAMVAAAGILGALSIPHQYVSYPRVWAYLYLVGLAVTATAFAFRPGSRIAAALVALTLVFFAAVSGIREASLYEPSPSAVRAIGEAAHTGTREPLGVLVNDPAVILDTPVWPDLLWYSDRPLVTERGEVLIPNVRDYVLADRPLAGLTVRVVKNGIAYATETAYSR